MATTQLADSHTITLVAGEDLTAKQFRFVKIEASTGQVVLCGLGEAACGVLMNKPDDGQPAEIMIGGIAKVSADAAVTAGDRVMSSADGQAATKTGTNNALGIAVESATGAASIFEVKLEQSDGVPGGGVGSFENTAITPTVGLALITVDGTDALTLADGTIAGQEITIACIAASNTPLGTLTINDAYGTEPTTWVFTAVGQSITLKWTTGGWKLIAARQAGVETVANAGTANRLCLVHLVAIADTVDFIQPAPTFAGERSTWFATANSGTPVGTVSGLFYDEDGSADGIDVNFNAAGDMAALESAGARWLATSLVSATITT